MKRPVRIRATPGEKFARASRELMTMTFGGIYEQRRKRCELMDSSCHWKMGFLVLEYIKLKCERASRHRPAGVESAQSSE